MKKEERRGWGKSREKKLAKGGRQKVKQEDEGSEAQFILTS